MLVLKTSRLERPAGKFKYLSLVSGNAVGGCPGHFDEGIFLLEGLTKTGIDFSSNAGDIFTLPSFLAPSMICALVSMTCGFFFRLGHHVVG
jgi:hypothetical protein